MALFDKILMASSKTNILFFLVSEKDPFLVLELESLIKQLSIHENELFILQEKGFTALTMKLLFEFVLREQI